MLGEWAGGLAERVGRQEGRDERGILGIGGSQWVGCVTSLEGRLSLRGVHFEGKWVILFGTLRDFFHLICRLMNEGMIEGYKTQ